MRRTHPNPFNPQLKENSNTSKNLDCISCRRSLCGSGIRSIQPNHNRHRDRRNGGAHHMMQGKPPHNVPANPSSKELTLLLRAES